MVKRQKEKQYQSAREHRSYQSIRSGSASGGAAATTSSGHTRPLPFHVCALSLNPYNDPVATPSGVIFDASVITPHLMKTGKDPVTGQNLTTRDLITLNMERDEETGKWQCPVLEKAFTDRTKVVAVRQNPPGNIANVYSWEAVNELNFKPRNYEDLTSGKKFHKTKDVIVLQDPDNAELCRMRDINNFVHITNKRNEQAASAAAGGSGNVRHSVTATRIMDKIKRKREEETEAEEKKKRLVMKSSSSAAAAASQAQPSSAAAGVKIYTTDLLGTSMTSGKMSSSLTSTAVEIFNVIEVREATAEEILDSRFRAMRKLKKKGFVRLTTSMGTIDLEIHADMVPRTATNFLGLVEGGKYDGSVFHRSIKNFMIQGGKPSNKGEKEESLWGEPFADEFDDRLSHAGPGILSMANAGPGTNKRQFFITFKSCTHLDRKHSVFGRVVKGLDVLRAMEAVPTDKARGDRPTEEIKIVTAEILGSNPAREAEEAERIRIEERAEARTREREERKASALGRDYKQSATPAAVGGVQAQSAASSKSSGVGKYLPKGALSAQSSLDALRGPTNNDDGHNKKKSSRSGDIASLPGVAAAVAASRKPKAPPKKAKWDFSGW